MPDTVSLTQPAASQKVEHFDVLIVGAGISGVGGAYHLTKQCPGTQLRRARGAGELRRHLAHAPLSRHPLRQRPLHLRLPLQAVDRRADRHGRGDPELHGRGDRRERPRPPHPLPPPDRRRRAGRARTTAGRSRPRATDTGETLRFTANFLWMCQGYYRHSEGYTPDWPGMDRLQGPHRPSADLAGGSRLPGQEGRRDRLGRDGGDADPGDRRRLRARHHAAALADLFHRRRATPTSSPTRCASSQVDESVDPRDRAPQDPARSGRLHPALVRGAGDGEAGAARRRARLSRPRLRRRRRTSRRATGRGGSASPSCRTATCSRASARARPRWSPTRSSASPRTGILLKSGTELEADIIVTATGFHLSVLGDIDFTIDGKPLDFADTVTYRGMMFTGVPNMVWVFGYFRASWTLRADLVADFVCRLLNHMKASRRAARRGGAAARGQGHAAAAVDRHRRTSIPAT